MHVSTKVAYRWNLRAVVVEVDEREETIGVDSREFARGGDPLRMKGGKELGKGNAGVWILAEPVRQYSNYEKGLHDYLSVQRKWVETFLED